MGFAPTHAARELAAKRARCEAAEIEDELFLLNTQSCVSLQPLTGSIPSAEMGPAHRLL